MTEILFDFGRAMGGMFLVLGGWYVLQGFVRRRSGCKNPNKDVLDFMLHGCSGGGHCEGKGGCHSGKLADSKTR